MTATRSTRPRPEEFLPLQPRDYLILLALADGTLHGHGILKLVEHHSGGVVCDPANLYRTLRKLERHDLVAEAEEPDDNPDARRRRFYRLTDLGRDVLTVESTRLARLADAARARELVADGREA